MTNYREILRLHSLGLNKTEIASSCRCARNTVAANCGLQWPLPEEMSDKQLSECLFPPSTSKPVYNMNYSVPFEYIKQKVDVRLTKATVEVFYGGNRICSHPRLYGRFNQYSTIQEHMPPEHQKYVQWNGERFIYWAGKVGSNTQVAVQAILSGYKVEQQGYKSCMGLLKLADKYTPKRLENACKRALEYTPRPSLKNIQAILASGQVKAIPEQSAATASSSRYEFTRGAAYYGRGNK